MDPKALLERNRQWAKRLTTQRPGFFEELEAQQAPRFLWIGCSDSRVPATEIVDLPPGSVFVHRNVGNVVASTDLNCLSVLQYGVDVLKVEHVIVCGHYGCGGVLAAMSDERLGMIDDWLRHIRSVHGKHQERLGNYNETVQRDLMCVLNVVEQVKNVAQLPMIREVWSRGRKVAIHGWVYSLHDGHLHDLDVSMSATKEITPTYLASVERVFGQAES